MAKSEVRLSKRALRDLDSIADYIAQQGAPATALAYVDRIETRCRELGDFPRTGRAITIGPDPIRIVPFEGVLIVYRPSRNGVRILAIFGHRQDYVRQVARLR